MMLYPPFAGDGGQTECFHAYCGDPSIATKRKGEGKYRQLFELQHPVRLTARLHVALAR